MIVHSPILLAFGIAAVALGVTFWRWSARHGIDLKGAAVSGAFSAVRSWKMPTMPDQLQVHLDAVAAQKTNVGRAKVVGGSVARHIMARAVGLASYIALIGGMVAIAASLLWK